MRQLKNILKIFSILVLSTVLASAYPNKPIEKTITFKAGGAADIAGRLSAKAVKRFLNNQFQCVNRLELVAL